MATAELPSISALTPEAKTKLLGELLKDLTSRQSSVTLEVDGISLLVHRPPANAREVAERHMLSRTEADREETRRIANDTNPQNWWTPEEMVRIISEEAARRGPETVPSDAVGGTVDR